jgi:hypothetical protein
MMLNDSTLAHGQVTNPANGGQATVTKTQTLPGVGPEDDGKSLVDLTAPGHQSHVKPLVIGVLALGVLTAGGLLVWRSRKRQAV